MLACSSNPGVGPSGNGQGGGSGAAGNSGAGASGGNTGAGGNLVIPDAAGAGGGASGDAGEPGDGPTCGLENFQLERVPAELLLVLDRSSSMNRMPVGSMGATLWDDTLAAVDQVVKATAMSIQWGLKLFPLPSGCMVSPAADVPMAANNYDPVLARARTESWNDSGQYGTPTGAAMNAAVEYLKSVASPNPKYILLATDGEPSCPMGGGSRLFALDAITTAAAAGYKTYVIGIAIGGEGESTLNEMAMAGGVPRADPMRKYYPAANQADLTAALNLIAGQVSNCVFPLSKPPPAPDSVKVTVGGERVPENPMEGWSYTSAQMTAIQLNGTWCERVKTDVTNVAIVFGCPGVVIP